MADAAPRIDLGPGAAVAVVDVGGTEIKTAVLTPSGALVGIAHHATPQPPDAVAGVVEAVATHVAAVRLEHPEVCGVGVVIPGIVDAATGTGVRSDNLGWRGTPFRDLLTARTGLPVAVGHDVTSAGRAELAIGAATGEDDIAVLVIGTGIAVASFSDGRPVLSSGYAGELGHTVVAPDGPECVCGGRGCLEALASAAAIARRYSQATGSLVDGAREVLARSDGGDAVARRVWQEAVAALAVALAQLAATLAPRVVVLGGGLSLAGDHLLVPLQAALDGALAPPLRRPELRLAQIGAYGGLVGAALLGREAAA